jgi:hypothetical protein
MKLMTSLNNILDIEAKNFFNEITTVSYPLPNSKNNPQHFDFQKPLDLDLGYCISSSYPPKIPDYVIY